MLHGKGNNEQLFYHVIGFKEFHTTSY